MQVYAVYFKCNKRLIREYPNLRNYTSEIYQMPGNGIVWYAHLSQQFSSHACKHDKLAVSGIALYTYIHMHLTSQHFSCQSCCAHVAWHYAILPGSFTGNNGCSSALTSHLWQDNALLLQNCYFCIESPCKWHQVAFQPIWCHAVATICACVQGSKSPWICHTSRCTTTHPTQNWTTMLWFPRVLMGLTINGGKSRTTETAI